MNQLALIESQLFFDPVVVGPVLDEEAGEVKVPTNKLSNDIRHLASSLLVTKEAEPPRKEVLKAFLIFSERTESVHWIKRQKSGCVKIKQ